MGRPKFNEWIKKNTAWYNYQVGRMMGIESAADRLLLALAYPVSEEDVGEFKKRMYDVLKEMREHAGVVESLAKHDWPFGLCDVQIKIPYGVKECENMLDEHGYCDECGGEEA